ncbi:hypothetical protein JNUCC42_16765 [Brevibacterium sp. JNUCC-42]|nr:hypothetical protein JNUCC42_16765 [Brevibacterium sp. JNUCC-42]
MNKALVFGATGSIGAELVLELLRSGIHTVAFARSDKKLANLQAEWEAISEAGNKQSSYVETAYHPTLTLYTGDVAQAIVQLAKRPHTFGTIWNIPGSGTISAKQIREIARLYNGRKNLIIPVERKLMTMLGWFQPFMREMVEMMYVTEATLQLDGSKYERELGTLVHTPYEQGIKECLKRLS